MKVTTFKIKRDQDNENGFFIVNVPEANQKGLGFSLYINKILYGISICNN